MNVRVKQNWITGPKQSQIYSPSSKGSVEMSGSDAGNLQIGSDEHRMSMNSIHNVLQAANGANSGISTTEKVEHDDEKQDSGEKIAADEKSTKTTLLALPERNGEDGEAMQSPSFATAQKQEAEKSLLA